MTVKIKDRVLYKNYQEAMECSKSWHDQVHELAGYFHLGTKEEFKKVVGAILDGEDVELKENLYLVPLFGLTEGGNQLYVFKDSEGELMVDWLDEVEQETSGFKLTWDEIPEPYRQWAVEVDDEL